MVQVRLIIFTFIVSGCLPWHGVMLEKSGSIGSPSKGMLVRGQSLPDGDAHFRFYRDSDRNHGTTALIETVRAVSATVAERHPDSVVLIGDISSRWGGFISGHRSHRSGRDVDFAFFVNDLSHRQQTGFPLTHFSRFGIGVRDETALLFDVERNWTIVEALLSTAKDDVQWIFVSDGLKALLLRWALEHDKDLEIVKRASIVLKQPTDAAPHDDHFHVRFYCPLNTEGNYCVEEEPIWPWIEERQVARKGFPREALVRLALH